MTKAEAVILVASALAKAGGFDLDTERQAAARGSASADMLLVEWETAASMVVDALIDNCAMTLKVHRGDARCRSWRCGVCDRSYTES